MAGIWWEDFNALVEKWCQVGPNNGSSDSYWLEVTCTNMDVLVDCCTPDPSSADPTKGVENYPFKWLLIHCHVYYRFHIICTHVNSDGLGSSAKDRITGGKKPAEFSRHTQSPQKYDEEFAELLQCTVFLFINCILLNIYWLQQIKHCCKEHKHNR